MRREDKWPLLVIGYVFILTKGFIYLFQNDIPMWGSADVCRAYLGCSSSVKRVLGLGRERAG